MKLFCLPDIVWTEGTLVGYKLINGRHFAEYTFDPGGEVLEHTDNESVEEIYGEKIASDLLCELLPKTIQVAYDRKNHSDSKPNLIGD